MNKEIAQGLEELHTALENRLISEDKCLDTEELSSYILRVRALLKLCEINKVKNRVRICSDYSDSWFAYRLSFSGPKFKTELEAIEWAEENGYHV